MREKVLGAYEKDCMLKCTENMVGIGIEIGNTVQKYRLETRDRLEG